jgi:endonuclease V-like protein UPF0215 family
MAPKRFSNIIGFDDAPFTHDYVGQVKIVGAVFTRLKLTGVLIGEVEKDGDDADVFYLHQQLGLPVLVVSRKLPNMEAVRSALLNQVRDGQQKWKIIKELGPLEPAGSVYVQRIGLTIEQARDVVERFAVHSHLPEPLRTAHLIAGALVGGHSRGRP